jgi:hypothetical protein
MGSVTDIYLKKVIQGADKSLARPTIYIYITNIPPILIINKVYENQNLLSL